MKVTYLILVIALSIVVAACTIQIMVPPITVNHEGTTSPQQPPSPNPDTESDQPDRAPKSAFVKYHGKVDTVITAVSAANEVLADSAFYKAIAAKRDYAFTGESAEDITNALKKYKGSVRVRLYKKPNTNTTAYFSSEHPNSIFLNSKKIGGNRHIPDITNTIVHELIHAVDRSRKDLRFGHGDNDSEGKEHSAPYYIGSLAECYKINNGDLTKCPESEITAIAKKFIENTQDFKLVEGGEIDEYLIVD